MSTFRPNSGASNNGTKSSSISQIQKKPSLFIRFIKGTVFQVFVFFVTIILLGVGYAAWTTLDRNDAANGKPVTQNLMQGIIDNINDLNNRTTILEAGGWVNVPLSDTTDFDINCEYRYKEKFTVGDVNYNWNNSIFAWGYPSNISSKYLLQALSSSYYYGIPSAHKDGYYYRDTSGNEVKTLNVIIEKMEKKCL